MRYCMTNYSQRISTYTLSFQKSSLLYIFLYFYTQDVSKIELDVHFWDLRLKIVLSEYSERLSEKAIWWEKMWEDR